jgi:hypothetical protein
VQGHVAWAHSEESWQLAPAGAPPGDAAELPLQVDNIGGGGGGGDTPSQAS